MSESENLKISFYASGSLVYYASKDVECCHLAVESGIFDFIKKHFMNSNSNLYHISLQLANNFSSFSKVYSKRILRFWESNFLTKCIDTSFSTIVFKLSCNIIKSGCPSYEIISEYSKLFLTVNFEHQLIIFYAIRHLVLDQKPIGVIIPLILEIINKSFFSNQNLLIANAIWILGVLFDKEIIQDFHQLDLIIFHFDSKDLSIRKNSIWCSSCLARVHPSFSQNYF